MGIKTKLIRYLKSVAKDTSEVDVKKDLIPLVMQKRIEDSPRDALIVGRFLKLLVSLLSGILQADPHLQKLMPLHVVLKTIYEKPLLDEEARRNRRSLRDRGPG